MRLKKAIIEDLQRGVTILSGTGGYTGESRDINRLKILVHEIDPNAFMVIGQAQEALREGFMPLRVDD
ncbi:MAG: YitT family protein [Chloroflexota bacterium]|nr:YitT family protein [Chloroflexota bacterium]